MHAKGPTSPPCTSTSMKTPKTKRCVESEGQRCILIPGDVKDAAFCKRAVKQTVEEFGRLDILVNNAAFQLHAAAIEDITGIVLPVTGSVGAI